MISPLAHAIPSHSIRTAIPQPTVRITSVFVLGIALLAGCGDGSAGDEAPPDEAEAAMLDATVLGASVSAATADELRAAVLTPLFEAYARENGIEVDDDEVAAWVASFERGMAEDSLLAAQPAEELTAEEEAEVAAMRREMGRATIGQWKLNKSLYDAYGGRVIYQQFGPEPLDAYREYLEQRAAAGDLAFADADAEAAFWRYFRDDSIHDFMEPGSDDEARAFAVAPWEGEAAES